MLKAIESMCVLKMAKGIYKELTLSIGMFIPLLYETWKKSMYYGAINIYKYPIS